MPAKNPRQAVNAFLGRYRRTVQCVARTEVFGTNHTHARLNGITFAPHGIGPSDLLPVQTVDGRTDFVLQIREQYRVIHRPNDVGREPYRVATAYYAYAILDRDEREIVVYQWHPEGVSDVTFPHLHIPRATPIPLAQTDPPRAVAVGEMHLPTNRVLLEDVVELLLREFAVAPQRADWRDVLTENRAALQQGRTW